MKKWRSLFFLFLIVRKSSRDKLWKMLKLHVNFKSTIDRMHNANVANAPLIYHNFHQRKLNRNRVARGLLCSEKPANWCEKKCKKTISRNFTSVKYFIITWMNGKLRFLRWSWEYLLSTEKRLCVLSNGLQVIEDCFVNNVTCIYLKIFKNQKIEYS